MNRWAAFTDHELMMMEGAIREATLIPGVPQDSIDILTPIVAEMLADTCRRRGWPTSGEMWAQHAELFIRSSTGAPDG